MSPHRPAPLVVNGWTLFAHPLLLDQLDVLIGKVESLRQKDPATYKQKNATKRLAAIRKLIFEIIPQDPSRPEFRQGKTLGERHKYWFRAKFFQQYRLFFRYHASSKVIVYPALFTTLPSRGVVRPSGCGVSRPSAPQAYSPVR